MRTQHPRLHLRHLRRRQRPCATVQHDRPRRRDKRRTAVIYPSGQNIALGYDDASGADAGLLTAVRAGGGHRRYRAAEIDTLAAGAEHATAVEGLETAASGRTRSYGRSVASYARRGRALTEVEVAQLAAAPTVHAWAELAAGFQAGGSSIRQIAASTGTHPATVAARVTRHHQRQARVD